ncbi:MAG: hypothetical protein LBU32_32430 [Clostridiales bacterium]|nr:hypothetical protein [Clostridiales bacterium]
MQALLRQQSKKLRIGGLSGAAQSISACPPARICGGGHYEASAYSTQIKWE